jgi:hypothetical protein
MTGQTTEQVKSLIIVGCKLIYRTEEELVGKLQYLILRVRHLEETLEEYHDQNHT